MDREYPLQNRHEAVESDIGLFGLVVTRGDTLQVLEFVEQALDEVAPAVIFTVRRDAFASVALGRDGAFNFSVRQRFTDGVGIIPLVGQ